MNRHRSSANTSRSPRTLVRYLSCVWFCLAFSQPGIPAVAEELAIESTLLKVSERIDVPARVAGVLTEIAVAEGARLEQGTVLGKIDDAHAKLAAFQARLEVDIARRRAEDDVSVRYAKKSLQVAKAELRRAMQSKAAFADSVSQTEIDRLQHAAEREALAIEEAQRDLTIAELMMQVKENELQRAQLELEKCTMMSPSPGVVTQIYKRRGEWVEPGDAVVQLVRMDKLRAEAYLDQPYASYKLKGQPVQVTVSADSVRALELPGVITYVSSEIDPVNSQFVLWADVENTGLRLQPGMRATMKIKLGHTNANPAPPGPRSAH